MSRNTILLSIIALALIALGVFAWYTLSDDGSDAPPPVIANAGGDIPAGYARTLGNPNAPIKLIEYAAPSCPVCARFNNNEFVKLKAQYIDTGKVFYTYRVFPISNPDFGAEGIARCLPKAQYLPFIDVLYHNQEKWDPDGHDIPDVRAALISMAGIANLPADKAGACIDDKTTQARTNTISQEATLRYGINGTPSFVIADQVVFVGEWPWDALKAAMDAKLPK